MESKALIKNAMLMPLVLLAGCSFLSENGTEPDEAKWDVIGVPASEVDLLDVAQRSVAFAFEGGLPSPCYAFEEAIIDRDSHTVHVRVRARYRRFLRRRDWYASRFPAQDPHSGGGYVHVRILARHKQAPSRSGSPHRQRHENGLV